MELTITELMSEFRAWFKEKYHHDPDPAQGFTIALKMMFEDRFKDGIHVREAL